VTYVISKLFGFKSKKAHPKVSQIFLLDIGAT